MIRVSSDSSSSRVRCELLKIYDTDDRIKREWPQTTVTELREQIAGSLVPISIGDLAEIIKVFSPLFRKDKPTGA